MTAALQPSDLDPGRARLAPLEVELARRELDLATLKRDLQALQARYLDEVGALYDELGRLETAVVEAEIRAGLRTPGADDPAKVAEEAGEPAMGADAGAAGGTNRGAPSDELKRIFRDVAKAIHPDLTLDEPARCRRHSLMAEANRAYAERDADRLRLILRAWERNPEAMFDVGSDDDRERVQRRVAEIDARLIAVEAEFADLRASAIFRLSGKLETARAQGWDLFAEMVLQVKREIAGASARLNALARQPARGVAVRT